MLFCQQNAIGKFLRYAESVLLDVVDTTYDKNSMDLIPKQKEYHDNGNEIDRYDD